MTTATLHAPAISCGHCVAAIKRAVGKLPGVANVDGDPATKRVTVSYDASAVSLEQISSAMAEEGYPVAS
ncbi:MAG: heavy-metal-associated domain-containing protein [Chloroflexi bacterium]|nr:heavy-metal-associated domain-containing protein [Chloroflexota bacterium]MBI4504087.1 heavy-metal-associated domain-containing protein [Chloroflexota bacterium]